MYASRGGGGVDTNAYKCVQGGMGGLHMAKNTHFVRRLIELPAISERGLPLIMYASRGGGGVDTNAYKCVQGGRGGLHMAKNTHFVRRLIELPAISET